MPDDDAPPGSTTLVGGAVELARSAYPDLAQPAAKEVGAALQTVGGVLNLVLRPIRSITAASNILHDRIDVWLREALQARAPHGRLLEAPPHIAGPALMALTWAADQDELRRLYVNLIASSMIEETRDAVHPAFVSILQQMTPSEARMIAHLGGGPAHRISIFHDGRQSTTAHRHVLQLGPSWPTEEEIQNLLRLQLITIENDMEAEDDDAYASLDAAFEQMASAWAGSHSSLPEEEATRLVAERCLFNVTDFGVKFRDVCIGDDDWRF